MTPDNKNYLNKLKNIIGDDLVNFRNPVILEFGVREGISTSYFIEVCKKNNGKLFSVDISDCSKLYDDHCWNFIQSRDDNFEYLKKKIPEKFDLIFLDSFHDADHVKKILYYYYKMLKKNGIFLIDDISWFPYTKNNYRDNFNCEINNKETFNKLLKIAYKNHDNCKFYFSFVDSGMCKILKKNEFYLVDDINIPSRVFSIKNLIRKFIRNLKSIIT